MTNSNDLIEIGKEWFNSYLKSGEWVWVILAIISIFLIWYLFFRPNN